MNTQLHRSRGFSLLEMLVALTLAVILGAVAVGVFTSQRVRVTEDAVIQKAEILDLAKLTYLRKNEASARTAWENAADDATRYELLKPYLAHPPDSFGDGSAAGCYTPVGYQYVLGELHESTRVLRLSDQLWIWPQNAPAP